MLPSWVTFHKCSLRKSYVTQLGYLSYVQAMQILCNPIGINFHKYRLCQSYVTQLGYLSYVQALHIIYKPS